MLPGSGTSISLLALELPQVSPALAGLTVGAIVGVVGFIAVLLIVGRANRKPARRPAMAADQVVFIPPYGTIQRDTPLPPQAFATPGRVYGQLQPQPQDYQPQASFQQQQPQHFPAARLDALTQPSAVGRPLPFVPSTSLSARVFAKMGYAVDAEDKGGAPNADPVHSVELDMFDEDELVPSNTPLPAAPRVLALVPESAPVLVSPVVVLGDANANPSPRASSIPPPSRDVPRLHESGTVRSASADKSAPHPLGIIKSSSTAMKAAAAGASIADLAFDDGPTEIGETYFDEPPQPRRRTDPPKIRPIAPSGPRYPTAKPVRDDLTPPLPRVTPPPTRAVRRAN
jgi:hypothetical protein